MKTRNIKVPSIANGQNPTELNFGNVSVSVNFIMEVYRITFADHSSPHPFCPMYVSRRTTNSEDMYDLMLVEE